MVKLSFHSRNVHLRIFLILRYGFIMNLPPKRLVEPRGILSSGNDISDFARTPAGCHLLALDETAFPRNYTQADQLDV